MNIVRLYGSREVFHTWDLVCCVFLIVLVVLFVLVIICTCICAVLLFDGRLRMFDEIAYTHCRKSIFGAVRF